MPVIPFDVLSHALDIAYDVTQKMEVIAMLRWSVRSVLCSVVIAALSIGLVACGHTGGSVGSMGTAGPTHGVVVEVGAADYATTDTLAVMVRNELSDSIIATDHQTSCTIVQLQREANGAWQNVGGCSLGLATRRITLAAGSSTAVQVAPGAGQISAKPWSAGTYRIAFTYQPGPDATSPASETVYSASFTVS